MSELLTPPTETEQREQGHLGPRRRHGHDGPGRRQVEGKRQADVLPEYDGKGAAAEGGIVDLGPERPLRPVAPTERLVDLGRSTLEELPEAPAVDDEERPEEPLLQRIKRELRFFNPAAIPGSKVPLVVFGLIGFLGSFDDQALAIVGPELRTEFGVSLGEIALISFLLSQVSAIAGLPLGYLVDRVKRVWLVRISVFVVNAANIVKPLAGSYIHFTLIGSLAGLIGRGGGVATGPMMADYYPSRTLGRVSAVMGMLGRFGDLIGLLLVGQLIVIFGWRQAVFSLAIIATVVSVLTMFLKEPVRGGMTRQELGLSAEDAAVEQRPLGVLESFRAAWSIKTVRYNAFMTIVGAFSGPVFLVIGRIQQERFFLDAAERSYVQAATTAAGIVMLLIAGPLSERFLKKRPEVIMLAQVALGLVGAVATVASAFAPNLLLFHGPSILIGGIGMLFGPAAMAIMVLVIPPRIRGLGSQLTVPFTVVGGAIGLQLTFMVENMDPQRALLMFTPVYLLTSLAGLIAVKYITADIRAARAAAAADLAVTEAKEAGSEKLLVARDIDVIYDGAQVLFSVDFDVHTGETVALLGTNGAGKSTLLRAMAGLHMVDAGAVFFDGEDVTAMPPHELARLGMVYVPGGRAIFPNLTVEENLRTATWADDEDADVRIEEILTFFPRLRERLDQHAGSLSGGEQQMVALSQAFLMRPDLLLIDELSLGLAPAIVEQLLEILRAIREQGTTLVLVEQSLNVASIIAERAVFMDKGRIEFDGPIDELMRRPDLVRSIFMGGTAAGGAVGRRVHRADDGAPLVTLGCEGVSLSFGGVQALRGVDLAVAPGEIVGIIGPNGAGKTTLFDVVSGYLRPGEGKVVLNDEDVTYLPPYARAKKGLGRSFQSAQLFAALTVRETIAVALEKRAGKNPLAAAFWAPGHRQREARLRERVDGYIDLLGLGNHADKFIRELSTGSRRAVDVACAMANEPIILLLDEPSSGLAQAEIEALGPTLVRLSRDSGCALVVIEHDLPLITSISHRLVAMELGQILTTGSPEEVTRDPQVLSSYLNASEAVLERSGSHLAAVLAALEGDAPRDPVEQRQSRRRRRPPTRNEGS